jgi:AraC-like DNA-binding protein
LTPDILWTVCDNVRALLGRGWYLQFPVLWSLDVQSQMECAMRFAPRFDMAIDVVQLYGHRRWSFLRWRSAPHGTHIVTRLAQAEPVSTENWHMSVVVSCLNFMTILNSSFPDIIPHMRFELEGNPPEDPARMEQLFGCPIMWNASESLSVIPRRFAGLPSLLADSHVHATLLASLDIGRAKVVAPYTARVVSILADREVVKMPIAWVAGRLGVSVRSLERNLAAEQISYRRLQEDVIKRRMQLLLQDADVPLATVVENLGYSDETALSRAVRRWYGKTLVQLRRELAAPTLRLN